MRPDLIYDVGLHNGDDTAHYLAKGYRVVAIDANPVMIDRAQQRFADSVADGRLTLLNLGIFHVAGRVDFHVSEHDDWSSFESGHYGRQDPTANMKVPPTRTVEVPTRPFADVLLEFGVPFYLKIDIEGLDGLCLDALREIPMQERPKYVSWEAWLDTPKHLFLMHELGYSRFKLIRQFGFVAALPDYLHPYRSKVLDWVRRRLGHGPRQLAAFSLAGSGPFGEDTDGDWQNYQATMDSWLAYLSRATRTNFDNWSVWWDVHAARD